MKGLSLALAALVLLVGTVAAAQPPVPQVSLRIDGLHSDDDGVAVMNALREIPNLKVANKPTPKLPVMGIVPLDGALYDLGDLAQAVAKAKVARPEALSATLIVGYKRLDANALADDVFLPKVVEKGCAKLKGVDAKKCQLDAVKKELRIKLEPKGGAKWADLKAAFPGLLLE